MGARAWSLISTALVAGAPFISVALTASMTGRSKLHLAAVAVDADQLAVKDAFSTVPRAHDRRDAVFASDYGSVGQDAADVGHQPTSLREKRCPRRCSRRTDEDSVWLHAAKVRWRQNQTGFGHRFSWTDGKASQ